MKRKQEGPSWGGQNWRPGKESGTWFRHSPEYGPMVHYGDYLVILQGRRKLSHEEWLALREQDKVEASRRATMEAEAKKARELPLERVEKQAIIDRLISDTKSVVASPDWKIRHITSVSYEEVDGIQNSPYENKDRYGGSYFQSIKWMLYYKGFHVWTWECGCWRRPDFNINLLKVSPSVEQEVHKCLEHHMVSSHAYDPVSVRVTPSLVEPKDWVEGPPCGFPVCITLVGEAYDYHYSVKEQGADPVYERLTGGDPQDAHIGWGWGND